MYLTLKNSLSGSVTPHAHFCQLITPGHPAQSSLSGTEDALCLPSSESSVLVRCQGLWEHGPEPHSLYLVLE